MADTFLFLNPCPLRIINSTYYEHLNYFFLFEISRFFGCSVCMLILNLNFSQSMKLVLLVKDGGVTFWSTTERGIKAELRLQHHPYDTESWGVLIREAQVKTGFFFKQISAKNLLQRCELFIVITLAVTQM